METLSRHRKPNRRAAPASPPKRLPSIRARVESAANGLLFDPFTDRQILALELVRVAVGLVYGCEERVEENVANALRDGASVLESRL